MDLPRPRLNSVGRPDIFLSIVYRYDSESPFSQFLLLGAPSMRKNKNENDARILISLT